MDLARSFVVGFVGIHGETMHDGKVSEMETFKTTKSNHWISWTIRDGAIRESVTGGKTYIFSLSSVSVPSYAAGVPQSLASSVEVISSLTSPLHKTPNNTYKYCQWECLHLRHLKVYSKAQLSIGEHRFWVVQCAGKSLFLSSVYLLNGLTINNHNNQNWSFITRIY